MKTKVFIALAFFAVITTSGNAQEKAKNFSFELNGGPAFQTKEFVEGIRMGFGFEGTFQYRFLPSTSVYAGWGWNWLSTELTVSENNMDYEETGYVLGLDFSQPIGSTNMSYYVRAGALYNHIESENSDGDILDDSGHGLGFQLAGGIYFDLGSGWSLTPGLKFNSLSREIDLEETSGTIDYQYLSARIGIMKRF
jgi:hypothetical protein